MSLVEIDFYYNFINGNVKSGHIVEPMAVESKLRRILTEPLKSNSPLTYSSGTRILHIKPQYQTLDKISDSNFLSSSQ